MGLHLLRLVLPFVALCWLGDDWRVAVPASLALYLGAFSFTHDVAHGALRLPRRWNEWLLSVGALPMLVSGHTMRLMHLRHHARPLACDDLEGEGAATTLGRAVVLGPSNALRLRVEGWRAANGRERRWMAVEMGLAVGLALVAVAFPAGRVWLAVCLGLQLTASAWASHLPHHPPRLLARIARRLAWTRSATVLSFVFHGEHHAHPKVPCAELVGSAPACRAPGR